MVFGRWRHRHAGRSRRSDCGAYGRCEQEPLRRLFHTPDLPRRDSWPAGWSVLYGVPLCVIACKVVKLSWNKQARDAQSSAGVSDV